MKSHSSIVTYHILILRVKLKRMTENRFVLTEITREKCADKR